MQILNDIDIRHPNQFQSVKLTKNVCFSSNEGNSIKQMRIITGNSSRPFHIPNTWRDNITCFKLSKAGSAVHPVFVTTVNGESFVIPKMLQASFKNVSAA